MGGLWVLITNIRVRTQTGTETYVWDLATALRDRGHTPIVYSTDLGAMAQKLRAAAVQVIGDLDTLARPPDVIHGHHNLPTMTAVLRFPGVPAIFLCHDALAWHDSPPRFPRILRYIAVDVACRERMVFEHNVPGDRVRVLYNAVDLKRFKPRNPLPIRPKRALVFSNYASKSTHLDAVYIACRRAGIELDVIGEASGSPCERPEEVLGRYDLVFAKARCALEAMAVGTAVVLCDALGVGPMVTTSEVDRLRPLNFGRRAFREAVSPDALMREIARYDAEDAAQVSRWIRVTAGLERAVEALLALYQEVIAEQRNKGTDNDMAKNRAVASCMVLAWRLRRGYGPIKYRFVLPACQRIMQALNWGVRSKTEPNGSRTV